MITLLYLAGAFASGLLALNAAIFMVDDFQQYARPRHQRNLEQRTPHSCVPLRSSGRPAGSVARTVTSRPMFWSTRRAG